MLKPLANCVLRTAGLSSALSATFGPVRKNSDGTTRNHQGIDLAADIGTPVLAVSGGQVVAMAKGLNGYGWTLTLRCTINGRILYPFYAHLSAISVGLGAQVKTGQTIARTGASGNAQGLTTAAKGGHLHFEMRTAQNPGIGLVGRIDPLDFVALDKPEIVERFTERA